MIRRSGKLISQAPVAEPAMLSGQDNFGHSMEFVTQSFTNVSGEVSNF